MHPATSETRERASAPRAATPRQVSPPVDIYERGHGFVIVADVPGVSPEALRVEFEPPELHLRGEVPERGMVYERRFELGSSIDPSTIDARLKDGVLTISLQKSDALRSRRIAVKAT
jgi:HSP20 family protein